MPTARRPIAREPTNLASARAAGRDICFMSVASHRNGHKDHDDRRLRDRSETVPDHARLNRATEPYCLVPRRPRRARHDGLRRSCMETFKRRRGYWSALVETQPDV
jgi:hypothetical protein